MSWLPSRQIQPNLSKSEYRKQSRKLRRRLQKAQNDQRATRTPTLILFAGVDGAGKGESVNLLNTWLDARWLRTRAFDDPSDEETERPAYWRYWRSLPAEGQTALFLSAWYSAPLLQHVHQTSGEPIASQVDRIRGFEAMLAAAGCTILKIWLHLSRDAQVARFRQLESDPLQSWRVTERDWHNCSLYPRFANAAEELLTATHSSRCPWVVIDGEDPRRRDLEVAEAVLGALRGAPEQASAPTGSQAGTPPTRPLELRAELPLALDKTAYETALAQLQGRLNRLHRVARERGISLIGVFEGRDAAGKGGAIRRVVPAFDARRVDVVRIGPPSDEEIAHHYLWRFWRRLPRAGRVTLFDRSWYGRLLVERVEELIEAHEWERAFGEINEFEQQLVEHGIVLAKFWLEISADEQERRFEERQRVAHKRWKFTEDDARNRGFWQEYDTAIADVLARTHSEAAPWIVVPSDDKRSARLTVLRSLCDLMEQRLEAPFLTRDCGA